MADSAAAFTTFGALLRYLRRRARLTQIDLAIATGYSTGQISRLEQNQRSPNPDVVHALFVPALALDGEPELAARLLELARAAQVVPDGERHAATSEPDGAAAAQPATSIEGSPLPSGPLLRTKLYVPRPRPNLVARPRLLRHLDAARDVPLTVVSAPAGWGKTMLLADWLNQGSGVRDQRLRRPGEGETGRQGDAGNATRDTRHATLDSDPRPPTTDPYVAWLSLDDGDNDPLTFLRYLIAALQTVDAGLGDAALALMQAPQPPGPELLFRSLLNDLTVFPYEAVLVLEDYHRVTTAAVHDVLAQLLEYAPSTLHVVVITRADPPLPLARLRARGQLLELRAAELRFTAAEATQFLNQAMGLSLDATDVAALETRTEGWIAGLQLAALALRGRGDVTGFVSAFTGSNRFVVDYLAAEVFERQPPHLQAFLLQTSILDRMCGPLCDAVMGVAPPPSTSRNAYSQALLEELERSNLFVVPLDDARRWYRYHHLFGDVLRERLQRDVDQPVLVDLHRRAGHWYERHELLDAALDHFLAAGDEPQAALLIERRATAFFDAGSVELLERLVNRLPRPLLHARPKLLLSRAIIANIRGAPAQALEYVAQAEALGATGSSTAGDAGGEPPTWLDAFAETAALTRTASARMVGDARSALGQAQHVLAGLPARWPGLRAWGQFEVGIAQAFLGDLDAARTTFAQVLDQTDPTHYPSLFLYAAFDLGRITILQGRLREVAAVYEHTLQRITSGGIPSNDVSALLQIGLAAVAYEWNELERAATLAQRGIELVTDPPRPMYLGPGYSILALARQAQGDASGAKAAVDQVAALLPGFAAPYLGDLLLMFRFTQAWLGQYAAAALREWDGLPPLEAGAQGWSEFQQLAHARLLLAEQQPAAAARLLEPLLGVAEAGRAGVAIEALVVYAGAQAMLGDETAALAALEQALTLAEPEGYVRIFVDEGRRIGVLLRQLRAHDTLQAYAGTLLAAVGIETARTAQRLAPRLSPADARSPSLTLEPLSEREREVLRLMADGLSNAEIAARLVVGVSTVKKHINNMFSKLAVQSRPQALVRARELHLL